MRRSDHAAMRRYPDGPDELRDVGAGGRITSDAIAAERNQASFKA